ncbi:MAG: branched-chain amino acid ABC transporter permease [Chloroflexi bacterium CFX4]|nr:branched-chain amino acid ABC transporter permease [Chloroflexi bacterium CFX4]MDL1921944.1 branched-chain amino acid ABC transporter permease [Chloroflexi bacterium CFX3]
MATNALFQNGAPQSQPNWREALPTLFALGYVAIVYFLLHSIDRSMLLFPLWSSILFPMFVISPFIILGLKIDGRLKVLLIAIIGLVLMPILGLEDTFYLELITQIAIFAAMAIGLNVVVGFAGLLDLGYVAFFAVGAYLWGVFTSNANTIVQISGAQAAPELFWLFLFLGVIAAAITGILLGLPVLRLRGDYLAIVTLGFGEIIRILVSNLSNISSNRRTPINITNGAQGLPGIVGPPLPDFLVEGVANLTAALGIPATNVRALTYQLFYYVLVLGVCAIAALVAARLDNSPIGRAWTAIREDEVAAQAMGIPKVRMKLLAFAMGASFAGAMGVIFAAKNTFVSPESFSFIQSIFILAIVIVGGMGSIRGVILGAVIVTLLNLQVLKNFSLLINSLKNIDWVIPIINFPIRDWPQQLEPARYERFVFGLLLIIMMIFRPSGVLPAKRRQLELQAAMGKEEIPEAEIIADVETIKPEDLLGNQPKEQS